MADKLLRFMWDAFAAAAKSKDPSTQVGAVALDSNFNIVASGWNGFPRGVRETEERLKRPVKYSYTVHSEQNLVAHAAYMGKSLKGTTVLLTSLFPCTSCTRSLIQAGVVHVVAPALNIRGVGSGRTDWDEEKLISAEMFAEAGVQVSFVPAEVMIQLAAEFEQHIHDTIMKISTTS